ncbi:MAG TPA: YtxH domain-containing protein [Vicinamibacterales bacterium]|nr:YtxH domain-containing protein [Vicinamibacterales bacterium]
MAHNLKFYWIFGEARVGDKVVTATLVGAVIGGIVGYLFFTDRGRELRRQIEPALDDFARELNSFRGTVQRAAGVASESWKLLNDALGEGGPQAPRYPGGHQTSPF